MLNATRGPWGGTDGSNTDASTTSSDSGTRPADTSKPAAPAPAPPAQPALLPGRTEMGLGGGKSTLGRVAEGASQL